MSLGETIYKLRTEKNLSQGDLAEKMEVSRQSVSKWENNSAVPDLSKIVKLSELFEVSLDELVRGEAYLTEVQDDPLEENSRRSEAAFPSRKLAGIILFCMSFLLTVLFMVTGGGLWGLILAIPFLICGTICFICKKYAGLWCAWAVFVCMHIYLTLATGIRIGNIFYTLRWTEEMNYVRLGLAWGVFAAVIALITVTVVKLRKTGFENESKAKKCLLASWLVATGIWVFTMIWPSMPIFNYLLANILSLYMIATLTSIVFEWAKIIAVTVALTNTARFLFQRKAGLSLQKK